MEYVLSLATNKKHVVYHTEACPYAKRIKYKNKMMISSRQISSAGYEPCACCNNDSRYLKPRVKFFKGKGYSDLEIKQVGNYVVYVRTNVGFWKVFLAEDRDYILFHRNVYEKEKSFDELIIGSYHRQSDVKGTSSLERIFNYIREHDKAKVIMDEDWRKLPTRTKKQKKYYKSAEKRDKKRQVRNVFSLFAQLEADNPKIKKSCFV